MLTGQDVHNAYLRVNPSWNSLAWDVLLDDIKEAYEKTAQELNRTLEAQQVTIASVRCNACYEMLDVEHCEGHACWLA
jgi:hypothetical protein